MEQKNHHTTDSQGNKKFHINISFILSTYRVLITFTDDKFQLDLRGTEFGELIGFEEKLTLSRPGFFLHFWTGGGSGSPPYLTPRI